MPTWLNPKDIALIILALLIAAISGLYLWQRGTLKDKEITITRQKGDIAALTVTNKDMQGQINDYKTNIAAMKKTQDAQHLIAAKTSTLQTQVDQIKTNCRLEANDEKILSDITYYFNSRGLYRAADTNDNSKTGGEILPATGAAGPDGPHWTIRQVIDNYLTLMDYTLQLEETVTCYGQN